MKFFGIKTKEQKATDDELITNLQQQLLNLAEKPESAETLATLLENSPAGLDLSSSFDAALEAKNLDALFVIYSHLPQNDKSPTSEHTMGLKTLVNQTLNQFLEKHDHSSFNFIAQEAIQIPGVKEHIERLMLPEVTKIIREQDEPIKYNNSNIIAYEDLVEQYGEKKADIIKKAQSIEIVPSKEFENYTPSNDITKVIFEQGSTADYTFTRNKYPNISNKDFLIQVVKVDNLDLQDIFHSEHPNKILASTLDEETLKKLSQKARVLTNEEIALDTQKFQQDMINERRNNFLASKPFLSDDIVAGSSSKQILDFAISQLPDSHYLEKFVDLVKEQTPEKAPILKAIAEELEKHIESTPSIALSIIQATEKLGHKSKLNLLAENRAHLANIVALTQDYSKIFPDQKGSLEKSELESFYNSFNSLKNSKNLPEKLKENIESTLTLATMKCLNKAIDEANIEAINSILSEPQTQRLLDNYKREREDQRLPVSDKFIENDVKEHLSYVAAYNVKKHPNKFKELLEQKPSLGRDPFGEGTLGQVALDVAIDNISQHPELMNQLIDLTKEQYGKQMLREQVQDLDANKETIAQITMLIDKHYNNNDHNATLIQELANIEQQKIANEVKNLILTPYFPAIDEAIDRRMKNKLTPTIQKLALSNVLVEKLHYRATLDIKVLEKLYSDPNGHKDEIKKLLDSADPYTISQALRDTKNADLVQFIFKHAKHHQIQNSFEAQRLIEVALEKQDNSMLADIVTRTNESANRDEVISFKLLQSLSEKDKNTEITKLLDNLSPEAMTRTLLEINIKTDKDLNLAARIIDVANKLPNKNQESINEIDKVANIILLNSNDINKLSKENIDLLAPHYDSAKHHPNFLVKLIDSLDDPKKKLDITHIKDVQTRLAAKFINPYGQNKTDVKTLEGPEFNTALTKYLKTKRSVFKSFFRDQEAKIEQRVDALSITASKDYLKLLEQQEKKENRFITIMAAYLSPILNIMNKGKSVSSTLEKFQDEHMQKILNDIKSSEDTISPLLAAKICNRATHLIKNSKEGNQTNIQLNQQLADLIFQDDKAIEKLNSISVNSLAKFYDHEKHGQHSSKFLSKLIDNNYNKEQTLDFLVENIKTLKAKVDKIAITSILQKKRTIFNPMRFREDSNTINSTSHQLPTNAPNKKPELSR